MSTRNVVIGTILFVILVIGSILMFKRWVSSVAVYTKIERPAPNVECVVATSVDGIAMDCNWQEVKGTK